MSVQLDLLDPDAPSRSIWSDLPAPVRREVVEIFAALLVTAVRASSSTEEDASELRED